MDDLEPHEPGNSSDSSLSDQHSPESDAPPAGSASASLVTRLVLTALGGLACVFLWPAGGQMTIVALVVMAVVVWFGPWTTAPQSAEADDSITSPLEKD